MSMKNQLSEADTVDAFVVSTKINRSIYEHAKNLAQEHGIELGQF